MGDGPGAVSELEEVGSAARAAEEEGNAAEVAQECADGMQCFVAGTPVQMADGTTKPIEDVKVGESVLSRDQDDTAGTGKVTAHKVVQTFQNVVAEGTVVLHLAGGESIEATPGHRFFVVGRGFTQTSLLAVGNAIVTRAGPSTNGKPSSVIVERVEVKPGRATVYNLEVEGSHTFFVGTVEGGLWAHNAGCNNRIADSIANGHAYVKHILHEGQWGGMNFRTRQQFADFIDEIINNPDATRALRNGRTAFWDNETERS